MIGFILNIFKSLLFIMFYLLFERELQAGYFIVLLLAYYINFYANKFLKYASLVAIYGFLRYFVNDIYAFIFFLFMVSLIFFMKDKNTLLLEEEDEPIPFRPYEKEIRRLLFKHNPSVLHKVDTWLDEYKGRENILLSKLYFKYEKSETPKVNE